MFVFSELIKYELQIPPRFGYHKWFRARYHFCNSNLFHLCLRSRVYHKSVEYKQMGTRKGGRSTRMSNLPGTSSSESAPTANPSTTSSASASMRVAWRSPPKGKSWRRFCRRSNGKAWHCFVRDPARVCMCLCEHQVCGLFFIYWFMLHYVVCKTCHVWYGVWVCVRLYEC